MRTGAYFKCSNGKQFASTSTLRGLVSSPFISLLLLLLLVEVLPKTGICIISTPEWVKSRGSDSRHRWDCWLGACLPGLEQLQPHLLLLLLWSSDAAFNYQPNQRQQLQGCEGLERGARKKKQVRPSSQELSQDMPGHCDVLRCLPACQQLKQNLIFSNFQTTNSSSRRRKGRGRSNGNVANAVLDILGQQCLRNMAQFKCVLAKEMALQENCV